jgi:hypothetical protein
MTDYFPLPHLPEPHFAVDGFSTFLLPHFPVPHFAFVLSDAISPLVANATPNTKVAILALFILNPFFCYL